MRTLSWPLRTRDLVALLLLSMATTMWVTASPPTPPSTPTLVSAPTNGFWLTNVTYVYTNTAIRTPTIDLGQVTVFGSNTFDNATVISWDPSVTPGIAGYRLYYGPASGGTTNVFSVKPFILSVAFFGTLTNTGQWWAYATAFDSSSNESPPSTAVLFTPR